MEIILLSLLISIIGCLLHFTYGWSKKNPIVAIFSSVNESTWEHIKIAIVPTFIIAIIKALTVDSHYTAVSIVSTAICLLTIIVLIPLLFYFIKYFTKKAILWVDIVEFFIAVLMSQINYSAMRNLLVKAFTHTCEACDTVFYPDIPIWMTIMSIIFFIIVSGAVIFLSFFPPKNFLFEDPRNSKYGLEGFEDEHRHEHKESKDKIKKNTKKKK